jgi:hypothetical protein
MAAITTAALITAGVTAAAGAAKAIGSAKDKKKYNQLIENYRRQDIKNPYENLQVSTLGAVQQQESSAQNSATALYNLRKSGANAILGGTGQVLKQGNQVNQQIAAGLDQQQNRNELMEARGEQEVQRMMERREEADLAGLGNASNVANHNMWGGISDVTQSAGVAFGALGTRKDNNFDSDMFSTNTQSTYGGLPALSTPDL